ncbi:MSF1-domain-containing protein [Thelephora ganbajun]|uniref:MSF1-domain-containing protein n=1 Tax=Thelephora ganbajun TaxID=370292 RepID=A0ACB6ZMQ6_THEGA|nr:MSF1-domain-containing protein [Thelephora ganbajun]
MRFFSNSHLYDDPWSIVSLAFFLRYPNPYAAHVLSCDVISRTLTPQGTLLTTRLILKKGSLPKWAPKGIINRAESWILEESEVDPLGRVVRCKTRNLEHVKVMRVEEITTLRQAEGGKTLQINEARIVSRFGWGLAKTIENHGLAKFKTNLQRSREGLSHILNALRQTRLQPMVAGGALYSPMTENFRVHNTSASASPLIAVPDIQIISHENEERFEIDIKHSENRPGMFRRISYWFRSR